MIEFMKEKTTCLRM